MRAKLLFSSAAIVVGLGFAAAPASAQTYGQPDVGGEVIVRGPNRAPVVVEQDRAPEVRGVTVVRGRQDGRLPVTGGDIVGLVLIGAGATSAGAALMVARKRSFAATA